MNIEYIKLIGVLIIVVGFLLKLNTIAVVIVAGITTGLVSGLSFHETIEILGSSFVKNRYMTMFILTLPAVGLLEKNGLKERSAILIGKIKGASAGIINFLYTIIRLISSAFGLRLGGHPQFVRPLILPMAIGANKKMKGTMSKKEEEMIKGVSAASDNFGNFFGQNVFPAAGGVLLIFGTLESLGYPVDIIEINKYSAIITITAGIIAAFFFLYFNSRVKKMRAKELVEKRS